DGAESVELAALTGLAVLAQGAASVVLAASRGSQRVAVKVVPGELAAVEDRVWEALPPSPCLLKPLARSSAGPLPAAITSLLPASSIAAMDGSPAALVTELQPSSLSDALVASGPAPRGTATVGRWASDLADACAHLAAHGVAHCDVALANCMVSAAGGLVLGDLGQAVVGRAPEVRSDPSLLKGRRAAYAAPELAYARPGTEVSLAASDVFAAGV
ncbi:unnamed protein product, partial [Symbiodinium sp. KB8]